MPRNLGKRIAPLHAYQKTIEFSLLFHSIRTPKEVQKAFQSDPYFAFQLGIRLDFMENRKLLSGTIRPSGFKNFQIADKCFNLSPWIPFAIFLCGISSFLPSPNSLFLSLLSFILFILHNLNLGFSSSPSPQSLDLDLHLMNPRRQK